MRDDLLYYYERELGYLRRTGAEFARRYPKVAGRLDLEPGKCDDPHVERLLEGFAFLAARVHRRLDEDVPAFSDALLDVVYPHFARPIPSFSIAQFHLDPEQGKLGSGYPIPRGTALYSRPVDGTPCRFRTCHDTTLWPIELTSARWCSPHELTPGVRASDAAGAIRMELRIEPDVELEKLDLESLRFLIDAEPGLAAILHEILHNHCVRVLVRPVGGGETVELPSSVIRPVGFDSDDGLLPHPPRAFVGWRLLQEYFAFPEKFLFVDVGGFDQIRARIRAERLEVIFLVAPFERSDWRSILEPGVGTDTFRLGCAPIVNLFPVTAEPILLNQRRHEYLVVPDARRRDTISIFSVDDVVVSVPDEPDPLPVAPLHGLNHGVSKGEGLFWHADRRPSGWRREEGTDVYLRLVDRSSRLRYPDADAATVRVTAHNGFLPSRLPFGTGASDFTIPGGGPVSRVVALRKPTEPIEPRVGEAQMWRLISQLSLNYTSLVDGGPEALRELLRTHVPGDSTAAERQIEGIVGLTSRPAHARVDGPHGLAFARGTRVEVEFDEERFAGSGVFLLASILERVLALAVSMNSFSLMVARSRQRRAPIRAWAPRSGWMTLV